jgi:hypothetical protein
VKRSVAVLGVPPSSSYAVGMWFEIVDVVRVYSVNID